MKLHILIPGLFLLSFSAIGQKQQEAVLDAYEHYRQALLAGDGDQAAEYVDQSTIDYYSDILEFARLADSTTVDSLRILDKLMVLLVRHTTSGEQLAAFDGRALFAFAVDEEMIGKNDVENTEMGEVTVTGEYARANMVINGRTYPIFMNFALEEGKWKVNLTTLFPRANIAFDRAALESGRGENAFVLNMIEMASGYKPDRDIWEPVLKD